MQLTLTDGEATLLRLALNHFAKWNDGEVKRLQDATMHTGHEFYVDRSKQAKALADRLEG